MVFDFSLYGRVKTFCRIHGNQKQKEGKNNVKILKCEEKEGKLISAEVHYNQFTQEHEYDIFVQEKKSGKWFIVHTTKKEWKEKFMEVYDNV